MSMQNVYINIFIKMINFAINKLDCLGVRCSYCSYLDKFRKVLIDIFNTNSSVFGKSYTRIRT